MTLLLDVSIMFRQLSLKFDSSRTLALFHYRFNEWRKAVGYM